MHLHSLRFGQVDNAMRWPRHNTKYAFFAKRRWFLYHSGSSSRQRLALPDVVDFKGHKDHSYTVQALWLSSGVVSVLALRRTERSVVGAMSPDGGRRSLPCVVYPYGIGVKYYGKWPVPSRIKY